MRKIISSQDFLDDEIVAQKIEELEGSEKVILPIIRTNIQDDEGNDLYILIDGHHRKAAAEELGIDVEYEETEEPDGLDGEDLFTAWNLGGDWRDVETGEYVF